MIPLLPSDAPDAPPRLQRVVAAVARHRRYVLLAMLVLLHLLFMQGVDSAFGRTLLIGHFGLFLLWQPIVQTQRRLGGVEIAVLVCVVAAAAVWLDWGVLIGWSMVLAAIIGGRVFFYGGRWVRAFYLLAFAYLLIALLVLLLPQLVAAKMAVPGVLALVAKFVLPAMLVVMFLLPLEETERTQAEAVDLISSIVLFLLLAVLVLGTLAFMLTRELAYMEALLRTLASLAVLLLLLGWAWSPRAGFAGVGVLLTRHLASLGVPLEDWLHYLADHAMRENDPARFVDSAVAGMARLPWVAGGEWRAGGQHGSFGEPRGERNEFAPGELSLTLYTRFQLTPTLRWHFDLLARLLGEFHQAKVQAARLTQMSYVHAVHETGARVTHDVKNLLQSLNALCFAAESADEAHSAEFQALLRRQLPVISQRLQLTLDKLRRPAQDEPETARAADWWREAMRRYAAQPVTFVAEELDETAWIPQRVFDSALENLLQNAFEKRQLAPTLKIVARLSGGARPVLEVSDDGAAILPEVAAGLFDAPVSSRNGFGIGLYQVAREAQAAGYAMDIAENRAGAVTLRLSQAESEPTRA